MFSEETGKKKNNAFKSGKILKFLFFVADWLYRKIKTSLAGLIFTGYEGSNKYYESSLLYSLFQGYEPSPVKSLVRKTKKSIIVKCENGKAVNWAKKTADKILSAKLKSFGIFFVSLGFYSSLVYLLKVFIFKDPETMLADLIVGGALMAFSALLLIFGKQSLYEAVCGSFFGNALFLKFLGFAARPKSKDESGSSSSGLIVLFFSGMVLGILTYFIKTPIGSVAAICLVIAGAAMLYAVLCCPEAGFLLFLFAVPFLPPGGLVITGGAPCLLIAVCYFLKLARGKRAFCFEIFDLFVLMFSAMLFFGGAVSVARGGSLRPALMYLCFVLIYFAAVNMIRTKELIIRSITALMSSAFLVSLYGIYQNYFGVADQTWQDSDMFSNITGRVVSTLENPNVLAEYLILVIPFMVVSLFIMSSVKNRVPLIFCAAATALCLVYTWSRGSWLGLIFSLLILFVVINRKSLVAYLGMLLILPFAPMVLPNAIIQRITTIGNIADTSTSYRVSIWRAAIKMIRDYLIQGIGVGIEAFKLVYPGYSLAGIESAPHSHNLYLQICVELGIVGLVVFLAAMFFFFQYCFTAIKKSSEKYIKLSVAGGMCAVMGFLINGLTDYVWYNYRVYLMFWLVVSITVAICRFGLKNRAGDESGAI
ncbi:MAG: O-antigen ligase family protein [Oscillospiraceae bacterium]|nr:O-antigen ligase family protein [Oscillospiraceae bacterium]